jgi:hypothetical protein
MSILRNVVGENTSRHLSKAQDAVFDDEHFHAALEGFESD